MFYFVTAMLFLAITCGVYVWNHTAGFVRVGDVVVGKAPKIDSLNLSESESTMMEKILHHHMWEKKVSETDIEKIIDKVLGQKRGMVVAVDSHFRIVVEPAMRVNLQVESGVRPIIVGIGSPFVYFNTSRYSSQPTRAQVLEELKAKLDIEDYKGIRLPVATEREASGESQLDEIISSIPKRQ